MGLGFISSLLHINTKFQTHFWSGSWEGLGGYLGRVWGQLGRVWGHLGRVWRVILGGFGVNLGGFGVILEGFGGSSWEGLGSLGLGFASWKGLRFRVWVWGL